MWPGHQGRGHCRRAPSRSIKQIVAALRRKFPTQSSFLLSKGNPLAAMISGDELCAIAVVAHEPQISLACTGCVIRVHRFEFGVHTAATILFRQDLKVTHVCSLQWHVQFDMGGWISKF